MILGTGSSTGSGSGLGSEGLGSGRPPKVSEIGIIYYYVYMDIHRYFICEYVFVYIHVYA
jgi:hypothetical protein